MVMNNKNTSLLSAVIGLVARLAVLVAILPGAGCSSDSASKLNEYPERIARTLDRPHSPETATAAAVPERPQARDLRFEITSSSLDLLDFLSLNQCRLGQAVAKGNSALGKVAAPSQVMHQQRDFLLWAPACIEQLAAEEPDLSQVLADALQQKQQQRMKLWWNGWFAGEEWQALAARSARLLDWSSTPEDSATSDAHMSLTLAALDYALAQGAAWQQQQYGYDESLMEHHLQQLLLGESIGRWARSQYELTRRLNQVSDMLLWRQLEKPLCPAGSKTPTAEILQNVLHKFYLVGLQPYMSRNDRFGGELMQRLLALQELMVDYRAEHQLVVYQSWLKQLQQNRDEFQQASQRHVRLMSETLQSCGMMPAS